ncbi:hypothetical protein [Clostridium sp. YIM B02555]|uniref:hypothetical protein n=1 Tax=Clostridium sp. YIM B02555 TaxID=2911968 RepID=UPI001EED7E5B|nr:hypothetical protein [Clostridium sp. YIM B02555]
MEILYRIDEILLLNPHDFSYKTVLQNNKLKYSKRLLDYIEERKSEWKFDSNEDYRFYVLSETEQIVLKHCPKPVVNNPGPRYYSLAEILSGKSEVKVASMRDGVEKNS